MYAAHVIHRHTIVIIVNKHFFRRDFILLTTTMAKNYLIFLTRLYILIFFSQKVKYTLKLTRIEIGNIQIQNCG